MKFNSQICTTKIQSERLLALGLKKGTADCILVENPFKPNNYVMFPIVDVDETLENEMNSDPIPAWSLHRLIEMMPSFIEVDNEPSGLEFKIAQGKLVLYKSIDDSIVFAWGHGNLYDSIISCIKQLIEEGYFNKEYLEE
jgi:hypothetical protein